MSLADQIASQNQKRSTSLAPTLDEFGIPIPVPETPEYWVARALLRNPATPDRSVHCLHLRGNTIYLAHTPLKENETTLYQLTGLRHSVKKWEQTIFYEVLRAHLPRFSRDFLVVADGCYWDMKRSELIDEDTLNERTKREH